MITSRFQTLIDVQNLLGRTTVQLRTSKNTTNDYNVKKNKFLKYLNSLSTFQSEKLEIRRLQILKMQEKEEKYKLR